MIRRGAGILPLLSLLMLLPAISGAAMYRYFDDAGNISVTNDYRSIPEKYRSRAVVMKKGETVPEPPPRPSATAAAEASPAPSEAGEAAAKQMAEHRGWQKWRKPAGIAAGMVAAFIILVRICSALSSRMAAKVIYLAFFLGVFLYGYKLYAEQIVSGYFSYKQKILTMFKKSNNREAPEPGAETAPEGVNAGGR